MSACWEFDEWACESAHAEDVAEEGVVDGGCDGDDGSALGCGDEGAVVGGVEIIVERWVSHIS